MTDNSIENKAPLISVLMPVYNGGKTLHKSLASLLLQGDIPLELIAVNDCSTDNTIEVLQHFANTAPDHITVHIVQHETNGGVAKARNTALSHATGEYVVWLDADDYFAEGAFEQLLSLPPHDVVAYGYYLSDGAEKNRIIPIAPQETPYGTIMNLAKGKLRWNLWAYMTRRKVIADNGITFIAGQDMGEDFYFTIRVLLHAQSICTDNTPLYYYVTSNQSSMTNTDKPKHIQDIQANMYAIEKEINKVPSLAHQPVAELLKLTLKQPLLFSTDKKKYKTWQQLFPEANKAIDIYPKTHIRWVQRWAKKGWFFPVLLFNYLYIVAYKLLK